MLDVLKKKMGSSVMWKIKPHNSANIVLMNPGKGIVYYG